jgi:DNA-binding transcriptional regulator YhcF (GntR family)
VRITLDEGSRVPLSRQLADAIADRIRRGVLPPAARLPTVRDLAEDLGLAPNTVAKAYRVLEEAGLLVGRGRRGTFVTETFPGRPFGSEALLDRAARAFVARARRLGARDAEAVRAVRRVQRRAD